MVAVKTVEDFKVISRSKKGAEIVYLDTVQRSKKGAKRVVSVTRHTRLESDSKLHYRQRGMVPVGDKMEEQEILHEVFGG